MKKIIDVSEHQKRIDWQAIKASGAVDGVIIRIPVEEETPIDME